MAYRIPVHRQGSLIHSFVYPCPRTWTSIAASISKSNVLTFDEKTTWDYYNLTREIECTNRHLSTDLNLRHIHHKKDDRTDTQLFLGLLSYWIVNTIRYKLKQTGETCIWTEIVRRLSPQNAVTTEATNAIGEIINMKLCSELNVSLSGRRSQSCLDYAERQKRR